MQAYGYWFYDEIGLFLHIYLKIYRYRRLTKPTWIDGAARSDGWTKNRTVPQQSKKYFTLTFNITYCTCNTVIRVFIAGNPSMIRTNNPNLLYRNCAIVVSHRCIRPAVISHVIFFASLIKFLIIARNRMIDYLYLYLPISMTIII